MTARTLPPRIASTLLGMGPAGPRTARFDRFGPFTVHECLGVGGMAIVHRATVMGFGFEREVALKRLLPESSRDPRAIAAFVREAKLAAELDHPNIAKTIELGRVDETYFIAMELVRGRTLEVLVSDALECGALVPIDLAISLLVELCDAIEYANATQQVVHRDISPCNLIVTEDDHLKIIDFGVARSRRHATNSFSGGKPRYMAVEALADPTALDTRADVYSIGIVAWELITGRTLFDADTRWSADATLRARAIRKPSDFVRNCPPVLDEIILAALEHSRDARWQSAGDMRDALEAARIHAGARRRLARGSQPPTALRDALMPPPRTKR